MCADSLVRYDVFNTTQRARFVTTRYASDMTLVNIDD